MKLISLAWGTSSCSLSSASMSSSKSSSSSSSSIIDEVQSPDSVDLTVSEGDGFSISASSDSAHDGTSASSKSGSFSVDNSASDGLDVASMVDEETDSDEEEEEEVTLISEESSIPALSLPSFIPLTPSKEILSGYRPKSNHARGSSSARRYPCSMNLGHEFTRSPKLTNTRIDVDEAIETLRSMERLLGITSSANDGVARKSGDGREDDGLVVPVNNRSFESRTTLPPVDLLNFSTSIADWSTLPTNMGGTVDGESTASVGNDGASSHMQTNEAVVSQIAEGSTGFTVLGKGVEGGGWGGGMRRGKTKGMRRITSNSIRNAGGSKIRHDPADAWHKINAAVQVRRNLLGGLFAKNKRLGGVTKMNHIANAKKTEGIEELACVPSPPANHLPHLRSKECMKSQTNATSQPLAPISAQNGDSSTMGGNNADVERIIKGNEIDESRAVLDTRKTSEIMGRIVRTGSGGVDINYGGGIMTSMSTTESRLSSLSFNKDEGHTNSDNEYQNRQPDHDSVQNEALKKPININRKHSNATTRSTTTTASSSFSMPFRPSKISLVEKDVFQNEFQDASRTQVDDDLCRRAARATCLNNMPKLPRKDNFGGDGKSVNGGALSMVNCMLSKGMGDKELVSGVPQPKQAASVMKGGKMVEGRMKFKNQCKSGDKDVNGNAISPFKSTLNKKNASGRVEAFEVKPDPSGVINIACPVNSLKGGGSLPQFGEASFDSTTGNPRIELNLRSLDIEVIGTKACLQQRDSQVDAIVRKGNIAQEGRRRFASPVRVMKRGADKVEGKPNAKEFETKSATKGKSKRGSVDGKGLGTGIIATQKAMDEHATAIRKSSTNKKKDSGTSFTNSLPIKTHCSKKKSKVKIPLRVEDENDSGDDVSFIERELLAIPARLMSKEADLFNWNDRAELHKPNSVEARDDTSNHRDRKTGRGGDYSEREACEETRDTMARDRAMTVNDKDNWFFHITNYFADSALNGVAPLPNDAYQGKCISKEEGIRTRAVAEATRSQPQRNDSKS
jgi:hypothetical protein